MEQVSTLIRDNRRVATDGSAYEVIHHRLHFHKMCASEFQYSL
jgi:hypothetical protein